MKRPIKKILLFILGLVWVGSGFSQNLILLDKDNINQVKQHQQLFNAELDLLYQRADTTLTMLPTSVMDKGVVASSGDKHDYMSRGPYWWPDPEKLDGLPYIRRDGEVNPEIVKISDKQGLKSVINAVDVLGLAYFYSENENYAQKATELLEVWFLDSATRMNPNLNFGQAIPGRTEGRGIGIIETRDFGYLLDGISLIAQSEAWTEQHQTQIKQWVSDYLDWLINSQHGKDEAVNGNNHTTWYFVQTIAMALFTDQDSLATELQKRGVKLIIDQQLEADGKQPEELSRTRSWDYSTMNLLAVYYFAILSEKLGDPIWDFQEQKIKKALDFLLPHMSKDSKWGYPQIKEMDRNSLLPVLKVAANHYSEEIYDSVLLQQYNPKESDLLLGLRYP